MRAVKLWAENQRISWPHGQARPIGQVYALRGGEGSLQIAAKYAAFESIR